MYQNAINYSGILKTFFDELSSVFLEKKPLRIVVVVVFGIMISVITIFSIVVTALIFELKRFTFGKQENKQISLISKCLIQIIITIILQFCPFVIF